MSEDNKVRELEKRIEELENKDKNIGKAVFVVSVLIFGVFIILISLFNLAFYPNKLVSAGWLFFGVILSVVSEHFRKKWKLKGIFDIFDKR
jgi:protein-S-isoprenylcysteine O-methyltransferase Ste14